MRILIVRTVPGEIQLSNATYNEQHIGLARALIKAGHKCDILCGEKKGERSEKVLVADNMYINIIFVKAIVILKNNILRFDYSIFNNYDVIQTIEYNQIYTWHLAKKCKGKCIVYHGPYYSPFNKKYNLMTKVFDIFFVNRYIKLKTPFITKSNYSADYLRRKGIKNVKSIGVGIDPDSFINTDNTTDLFCKDIEKLNVKVKMLYIGRIEPRRNSLFLIDLLRKVRDKGVDAGLIIVGKGKRQYMEEFNERIIKNNLEEYVISKHSIEQKYLSEVYKMTDIFVLPTYYDIYGMVILEAMFFGVPIISSPCGGSQMMIKSGNNGFVINNFNVDVWADTIYEIVNDETKKKSIAQAANYCIRNNFTWDALIPKFVEAYTQSCGK